MSDRPLPASAAMRVTRHINTSRYRRQQSIERWTAETVFAHDAPQNMEETPCETLNLIDLLPPLSPT